MAKLFIRDVDLKGKKVTRSCRLQRTLAIITITVTAALPTIRVHP